MHLPPRPTPCTGEHRWRPLGQAHRRAEHAHADVLRGVPGGRLGLAATVGIRRAGSASLDLAYVAAGRMDGFWEMGLSKWDIAAGIVLVREAGGFVSDLSGGETFWDSGDIVAANPKCFKSLIQNLRA